MIPSLRAVLGAERLKMTKARLDGLYPVLLGSMVFLLLGIALEQAAPVPLVDFRGLYYPRDA